MAARKKTTPKRRSGSTASKRSAPAKKTTAKRAAAKKPVAKRATAKKPAAARKPAVKQAAAKKAAAKKGTATSRSAAKRTGAKQTSTKKTAARRSAAEPTTTKRTASTTTSKRSTNNTRPPTKKATTTTTMATTTTETSATAELPKPRFNKDGFGYTKDFDLSFVKEMYEALQEERVRLTGQAKRLEDEAHQLVEEAEMGDVQFDDEGGEGDTMVVERERDLALSAQAREAVTEIDAALVRITNGTYGYSVVSGRPIPRERLEAIPWATELVEEKVGGIGRR